jgi:hypothetical protein
LTEVFSLKILKWQIQTLGMNALKYYDVIWRRCAVRSWVAVSLAGYHYEMLPDFRLSGGRCIRHPASESAIS